MPNACGCERILKAPEGPFGVTFLPFLVLKKAIALDLPGRLLDDGVKRPETL